MDENELRGQVNRRAQETRGNPAYRWNSIDGTREFLLSFGTVGIVVGVFLVPSLLLLNAYFTRNRILGVFAVELIVVLVLVLNVWGVRSRVPLLGSARRGGAAVGWLLVALVGGVLLWWGAV